MTAKVGDGEAEVRVVEETDYPFADTITFTVSTPKPVKFPLYLASPRWCGEIGVGVAPKGLRHSPTGCRSPRSPATSSSTAPGRTGTTSRSSCR